MKLKSVLLKIQEIGYKILGKDTMRIRLRQYRLKGAKIGEGVRAFSPVSSAESYLIEIKEYVTISTGVKFITHDNAAIKIFENGTDLVGRITVGKNCFIGANSIILPGVYLANNTVVGAGSVVTKSFFEEGIIISGNPAKKISTIEVYKKKYKENVFDFGRGDLKTSNKQKKSKIEDNEERLLIK